MDNQINIQAVHHLTLTVSDVARSREFYSGLFGFDLAGEFGERVVLIKGNTLLALGPAPDPERAKSSSNTSELRKNQSEKDAPVGDSCTARETSVARKAVTILA